MVCSAQRNKGGARRAGDIRGAEYTVGVSPPPSQNSLGHHRQERPQAPQKPVLAEVERRAPVFLVGLRRQQVQPRHHLRQFAVGQFDLGPAAAFSLIYFLIILLLCFVLYNWMQRVGTQEVEGEQ